MATPAVGGGEQTIADPVTYFGLPVTEVLGAYPRKAAHALWARNQSLWDHPTTETAFFLDPKRDRYVVVSVDPAGGGSLSDEVFVVFLVADNQFGLLTANTFAGQDPNIAYAMVPVIFVLSLLRTIRRVRERLRVLHTMAHMPEDTFRMPPVIILIENNFAYGPATYQQMLWFVRRLGGPNTNVAADVDIVFATPVYGLNKHLVEQYAALHHHRSALDAEIAERRRVDQALKEAWQAKGPKMHGVNMSRLIAEIRQRIPAVPKKRDRVYLRSDRMLPAAGGTAAAVPIPPDADRVAAEVLDGLLQRAMVAVSDPAARGDLIRRWLREEDVQRIVTRYAAADARLRTLRAEVERIRTGIDRYLRENDGAEGLADEFMRIQSWSRVGVDHAIDANNMTVVWPPNHYATNAHKNTFGETTTEHTKAVTYRHFVHIIKRGGPMLLLLWDRHQVVDTGDGAPPDNAACSALAQQFTASPIGPDAGLVPARRVLQCVYHQWSQLQVTVQPGTQVPVRVVGKQRGPEPGADRNKDDVWMAFSLGMQWCAQFTRLLPDNTQRRMLVDFMRRLTQTVYGALKTTLNVPIGDAATSGVDPPLPPDAGDADAVRDSAPAADARRLDPREQEALVVVTAVCATLLRSGTFLLTVVRRLILAAHLRGYRRMEFGYELVVSRARQPLSLGVLQRRWQERCMRAILDGRRDADPDDQSLEYIRTNFSLPITTVRFVCASHPPGPRYAWPCFVTSDGARVVSSRLPDASAPFVARAPDAATSRKRPRHGNGEPDHDGNGDPGAAWARRALRQAVRDCVALVDRMRSGGILQDRHARYHPALSAPETESVVMEVMDRVRRHAVDIEQAMQNPEVLPRDIVDTAAAMPLAALNEAVYRNRRAAVGHGARSSASSPTPLVLLVVWARLMEDLAFLRSMVTYGRREIIAFSGVHQHAPGGVHRTRMEYRIPEATEAAGLSCRVATRPSLNWAHVVRVMFPAQYDEWRRADRRSEEEGSGGPVSSYVYRSQLQLGT